MALRSAPGANDPLSGIDETHTSLLGSPLEDEGDNCDEWLSSLRIPDEPSESQILSKVIGQHTQLLKVSMHLCRLDSQTLNSGHWVLSLVFLTAPFSFCCGTSNSGYCSLKLYYPACVPQTALHLVR